MSHEIVFDSLHHFFNPYRSECDGSESAYCESTAGKAVGRAFEWALVSVLKWNNLAMQNPYDHEGISLVYVFHMLNFITFQTVSEC